MLDNIYIQNGLNGIFLMFIVMFGEYIEKLFPCGFQKLFIRNIYCKYILAFFILFTSVILSKDELIKNNNIFILFGISVILYIWLICMTKMNVYFFITLLILLFILFTYVEYNKNKTEEKYKKTYNTITLTIFILSILITVVGFLLYYGEKKYEYKKMFSWKSFFFDSINCNFNPPKGTMKDYFLAIFNKNNI